jgi:uncharacterized membrane protein (TIGR02234 family)
MLVVMAGATLLLVAAGRTWASGLLTAPGQAAGVPVEVTGTDLTGVLSGIGWAGLAGIAGLYAARGWARRLIGVLVAGGGLLALATVWSVRASANLAAAIGEHATGAAGVAQVVEDPDLHAAGPAMAAVGAGLLVMSGLVAAVRATTWPGMGTRYDRVTTPRPHQAETPSDLWKSLDAGDDPTLPAPDGDGVSARTAGHAADIGDKTAPSAAQPTETKESPDDR